jgi:hypothetical protein
MVSHILSFYYVPKIGDGPISGKTLWGQASKEGKPPNTQHQD